MMKDIVLELKLWQRRIMQYNKVCFEEAINYIEDKYGNWDRGSLIENVANTDVMEIELRRNFT